MKEWCFAHPWMTFFIVLVSLEVVGNIFSNIAISCNNKMKVKLYELQQPKNKD